MLEDSDGKVVHKEAEIAVMIVSYFKTLFTSNPGDSLETVRGAIKPVITQQDNEGLIAIPTALEIKEAIFAINGEKAPGPDGFSASFYHTHWEEVGRPGGGDPKHIPIRNPPTRHQQYTCLSYPEN